MRELFIGLISGTSMDGVDAALVRFGAASIELLGAATYPYPDDVRTELPIAMRKPGVRTAADVARLDVRIGECFRDAANALLADTGVDAAAVTAIGSHGQTVRHEPAAPDPFSLQIGDPGIIARGTAITTVANFRSADIVHGGQGAPIAPAFHEWLFRAPDRARVVLNIGGIANITILPAGGAAATGYDTGPGNTLLDAWIARQRQEPFDRNGSWSAAGTADAVLLDKLLADPYFRQPPPKSTGFEYFNLKWLEQFGIENIAAVDIQATLAALTAESITQAVRAAACEIDEVLVCGGGAHNADLMQRLRDRLPGCRVEPTAAYGLDPDWVEAVAFAWLAMRRLGDLPGNLPAVTGASHAAVLGDVHEPP